MGHPSYERRQKPAASWEPVGEVDLARLEGLVADARQVEGEVADALRRARPGQPTGQIVTWAWVVDPPRRQVLLVDHSYFGKWLPPGGRARPGEHPLDAAARELSEETGITAAVVEPRPAFMDVVSNSAPDGSAVATFGIAFLHVADPSSPIVGEPDQPVAWWPLDRPPERRAHHHWDRLAHFLGSQEDRQQ